MQRLLALSSVLCFSSLTASEDAIARWEKAAGGHDRIAAIKSIYREADVQYGPYTGSLKVWHTSDGKYRREEHIAAFSIVETFDGSTGSVQRGAQPARPMDAAETQQIRSRRFANSNSMFFVFFPQRHRGTRTVSNNTIAFVPEGGIEWRVTLDPKTWLPETMAHEEDGKTITVTYVSYETFGGVQFEQEMHRSGGSPGIPGTIRFTKTVLNPFMADSLFRMGQ